MELHLPCGRRLVSPAEAFLGFHGWPGYGTSCEIIRIDENGTFHIQFKWVKLNLTALQMNMFDLWHKVLNRFSVRYVIHLEVGPWLVANKCIMYESDELDHVVHQIKVFSHPYDVRIYDKDGFHCYTLNNNLIRTLIALTMAINGAHHLY